MKINEIINEKAPPGREKQVKALKGKVDNPYAVAWASYNKSKNKTNEAPLDEGMKIANLVGQSIAHLEMYVELASDVKKQYPTLSSFTKIKAEQVLRSVPLLINDLRKPGIWSEEDAAGVGIITKQNTTQDVKPGETQRQAKKLHLR
ncbi:MAG: hypothetical protein H8D84_02410 [Proteobacteria bacterium]|nr:hypothetical protein [Pseudomonadota bacterium]